MAEEPISKAQKLTKSIEMMLRTVLSGAGYASKQMEVLLGRRLIARGTHGSTDGAAAMDEVSQINQNSNALTPVLSSQADTPDRDKEATPRAAILVVEPQATTRAVLRLLLEREGYQVFEADTGTAALKLMANGVPQLVLQSLALPDMDGFGLVQWLRTLPGGKTVPVLAVSDKVDQLERARSSRTGFTGFICRPCLPSYLLQTIFPFVPGPGPSDGVPAHWRQPWPIPSSGSPSPMTGGRIVVIEGNDYQSLHLLRHLAKLGFELTSVRDGWEAMKQAGIHRADAIVSDPLIPGIDGFELCLEMRKEARLAKIPVILTPVAAATEVDKELALALGAAGYISRSPDLSSLVEHLRITLRKPVDASLENSNLLSLRAS
jgi:CheY-like chemotaxis protein